MSKYINWPCWFTAALGGGWAIYLAVTLPENASTKEVMTVAALLLVSVVLLETKARREDV